MFDEMPKIGFKYIKFLLLFQGKKKFSDRKYIGDLSTQKPHLQHCSTLEKQRDQRKLRRVSDPSRRRRQTMSFSKKNTLKIKRRRFRNLGINRKKKRNGKQTLAKIKEFGRWYKGHLVSS